MSQRSLDYGFKKNQNVSEDVYESFNKDYKKILERRESRWDTTNLVDPSKLKRGPRLKSFCRKGIPQKYRIRVWMKLCEADIAMVNHPEDYDRFLTQPVRKEWKNVIDVDIPRTFPENEYFASEDGSNSRIDCLRNVLYAFANRNESVGYCQGLNYIAATILLAFDETESDKQMEMKTFWIMNQLVENIIPNYYSDEMMSLTRDCLVMENLLEDRMKDVYTLLKKSQIDMVMIATKWFICCFADVVPIETVFRIFDCLFYEGDKILFRAALTLIKMHKNDILKHRDLPTVLKTFKAIGKDQQTLYCHEFTRNMFSMNTNFSRNEIAKYRENNSTTLRYSKSLKVQELAKD